MNSKDKEAFDKWWISNKYQLTSFYWHDTSLVGSEILATWKAACEYMQAELAHHIFKIEAENKKLRDALEYLNTITVLPEKVKPIIREALKEIKE